jgi:hypothetical protein
MTRRIAVKTLTESDLTLFKYHHRRTAGKQKAINLNADVFVDVLYPELPEHAMNLNGRIPIDLRIFGPGRFGEFNLQRKILKFGSYKNWRLDGEFIDDPIGEPGRFELLAPGDFAILEFFGEGFPTACKMVLISQSQDPSLHAALQLFVRDSRMIRINELQLSQLVRQVTLESDHPVYELLLDKSLEDAAYFGEIGTRDLLRGTSIRKLSRQELERARRRAEDSGLLGEEFVNAYLSQKLDVGEIEELKWDAAENAISPFDFSFRESGDSVEVDAKSTNGEFARVVHVSINELRRMATTTARYDLYRVFNMEESTASLRIAEDLQGFAKNLLASISNLPHGVAIDSVSVSPEVLHFGDEIRVELPVLSE